MPRYYFDLHNDIDAPDEEGVELMDPSQAHARALKEAREMICASVEEHGRIDLRHHIQIRDETGAIVGVVKFEDAVTFLREGEPV
jgi:hypothetical protein